jgi:hypothetical protein
MEAARAVDDMTIGSQCRVRGFLDGRQCESGIVESCR